MAKTKSQPVGRSNSRTPFKHWLLDCELGRLVGVLGTGKTHAMASPFHIVDLCAGDGHSQDGGRTSPGIIQHHACIANRRNIATRVTLIERAPNTFDSLIRNTHAYPWQQRLNEDAKEWSLRTTGPHQAVFIHADPNTIADWPITDRLLSQMNETTTLLATLGCNVGGLKRLPAEQRAEWFEHVRGVTSRMPGYHDVLLISLDGDASQWAYLLQLPLKWNMRTIEAIQRTGKAFTEYSLRIASFRNEPIDFAEMQDVLFLTKNERGEA